MRVLVARSVRPTPMPNLVNADSSSLWNATGFALGRGRAVAEIRARRPVSALEGMMKRNALLRLSQFMAFVLVLYGTAGVVFAADGCSQEVRRKAAEPTTIWLHTNCNTGYTCDAPSKCTVAASGNYVICVCPTGSPNQFGWLCKEGFQPTGGTIRIGLEDKPLGNATCINWTCVTVPEGQDCPIEWQNVGSTGHQKLNCPCPGT